MRSYLTTYAAAATRAEEPPNWPDEPETPDEVARAERDEANAAWDRCERKEG